jgi:hypothetical protein
VNGVHITIGVLAVGVNAVAAVWGAWCWYRWESSTFFWRALRTGQALVVLEAAIGGVLLAIGHKDASLHTIYGLLPIAVSFIGEQLRISAAQMVLDARGFESAEAVGALAVGDQQEIVRVIVRREIGVMALAAFVIVVLLLRAATVVH